MLSIAARGFGGTESTDGNLVEVAAQNWMFADLMKRGLDSATFSLREEPLIAEVFLVWQGRENETVSCLNFMVAFDWREFCPTKMKGSLCVVAVVLCVLRAAAVEIAPYADTGYEELLSTRFTLNSSSIYNWQQLPFAV
jgi:hypothetical protein